MGRSDPADRRWLVSELVSNSVQHAGLVAGELLRVGAAVSDGVVRLEIDNSGSTGTIAAREPDLNQGGFGLCLVEALAHAWASRATVTASGWSSCAGSRRRRSRRECKFGR